jgi:hypothetical protein
LNVFTAGPAQVAFCPFTASTFFVVKGELSAVNAALVFPEVQAVTIANTHSVKTNVILFISFSSRSKLIRGTMRAEYADEERTGVKSASEGLLPHLK